LLQWKRVDRAPDGCRILHSPQLAAELHGGKLELTAEEGRRFHADLGALRRGDCVVTDDGVHYTPDADQHLHLVFGQTRDPGGHTSGWTAMHLAARNGHLSVVKELWNMGGAKLLSMTRDDGRTALMSAVVNGDNPGRQEIVEFFLEKNAEVAAYRREQGMDGGGGGGDGQAEHMLTMTDSNGSTCLHIAAESNQITMLRFLIKRMHELLGKEAAVACLLRKVSLFLPRREGACSPVLAPSLSLFLPVSQKICLCMPCTRRAHALKMPYRQDSREMTCVHRAVVAKNTDVFKTLTDPNTYKTPNADDEAADTKLAVDTCKELLTAVCFNHRSCLHLAAGLGKRKMVLHVRDLVKRFNMPEVFSMKQKDGRTAAHSASNFGHVDVLEILYNAPHGGKELISMEDDDGWTPLHWAADTMAPRIEEAFGASEAKIARHRLGLKWKEVGEAPPSAGGKELDSPALAAKLAQEKCEFSQAEWDKLRVCCRPPSCSRFWLCLPPV